MTMPATIPSGQSDPTPGVRINHFGLTAVSLVGNVPKPGEKFIQIPRAASAIKHISLNDKSRPVVV
jgi:hypothetical protein